MNIENAEIHISIESRNQAVVDAPGAEFARILRNIANHIDGDNRDQSGPIRDINGNTIGNWNFIVETEETDDEPD